MTSPLVSIIVPVYNAEQYLQECIESVLTLSGSDWELILIDDGSTDGSAGICESYVRRDSRIRYYYQDNSGVSAARNTGISYSAGTWITFLDADDCLMPDACKIIPYTEDETDYIILGYSREDRKSSFVRKNRYLDRAEVQQSILSVRRFLRLHPDVDAINGYNNWSCWGRFFRRTIICSNKVLFPVGLRRSEDLLFCLQYTRYIRKTAVNETVGYYYRMNPESVTQRYSDYLEDNTVQVVKRASLLTDDDDLKGDLSAFILNQLTKCCTDYYLHPQNCMSAGERAERLGKVCENPEVKFAVRECSYGNIALGKRNTIQNMTLLWFLRRKWYRAALRVLAVIR